jgi:hypothetical protein
MAQFFLRWNLNWSKKDFRDYLLNASNIKQYIFCGGLILWHLSRRQLDFDESQREDQLLKNPNKDGGLVIE